MIMTSAIFAASKISMSLASRSPISLKDKASIVKVFVTQLANVGGN